MIVWDKINIANNSLASGVTLTPHGGQNPYLEIDKGVRMTINQQGNPTFTIACDGFRPTGVSYNQVLNLQYESTNWSANYFPGGNFLETSEIRPTVISTQTARISTLNCTQIANLTNPVAYMSLTTGGSKTLLTVEPSGGITGQHNITIQGSNSQVTMTLTGINIQGNSSTWTNLYSENIYLSKKPPISTYATDASDNDHKINLKYSSNSLDNFAPLDCSDALEYATMSIVTLFNRVYDIYFTVGGKNSWVAGDHSDGWWLFEVPSELQSIMNSGTIVDKCAYQYEKRSVANPDSISLGDFTSQWQVSYFCFYNTNKWYLALGLDSHTSGTWCKISGMGHIRVIR